MKAVVLVGGEGTRLRPLTETTPKPLIPFLNRAFLHHVLDYLARHGVDEVVLSSPYLEEEFTGFLAERRGAPSVTWITEETPLGTGGAVAGARHLMDETFLVLNGDILTDLDLGAIVSFHRDRGSMATIALTHVPDARAFGLVERDADGVVTAFREKPEDPIPGDVNAGTYVLEPEALGGAPPGVAVSIERETFPSLIEAGAAVYGFVWEGYWRDLGTPESYLEAHLDALDGRIGGLRPAAPLLGEGAVVASGALVAPTATIGPEAAIGTGARIERSVLHERVRIGEDARVDGSILGADVEVGAGAIVRDAIVSAGARIADGVRVSGGRIGPGDTVG
ncbi:MAG: sugar phosphate nucleotidyltransferase [Actinomycetota bacterium]